jgi:hypothetical protein
VIVLGIIGPIVDFLPKIAIVWTLGTVALVFGAALTGEVPETSRETGTRFADAACGRAGRCGCQPRKATSWSPGQAGPGRPGRVG